MWAAFRPGSEAKREVTAAGADVGHHVVWREVEGLDDPVRLLGDFTVRTLEPAHPGIAHHVGDLAPHVDLADAVAGRRAVGVDAVFG